MANVFTTGLFKSPKYSAFHSRPSDKFSGRLGRVLPVRYTVMGAGDRVKSDLAHLLRFSPLQSPVMDSYTTAFDVHFVPFRLLDLVQGTNNKYERFFNVYENVDGSYSIDKIDNRLLFNNVLYGCASVDPSFQPINQSLYDYLNYPMYDNYRQLFREVLLSSNQYKVHEDFDSGRYSPRSLDWLPENVNVLEATRSFIPSDYQYFFYDDTNISSSHLRIPVPVPSSVNVNSYLLDYLSAYSDSEQSLYQVFPFYYSFLVYVYSALVKRFETSPSSVPCWGYIPFLSLGDSLPWDEAISDDLRAMFDKLLDMLSRVGACEYSLKRQYHPGDPTGDLSEFFSCPIDWSKVWDFLGVSYDDIYQSWICGVMYFALNSFSINVNPRTVDSESVQVAVPSFDDGGDLAYPLWVGLPFERVNILPLLSYWRMVADWYVNLLIQDYDADEFYSSKVDITFADYPSMSVVRHVDWTPINRSWKNDYFTSGFPNPQAGSAVLIPVNGTMQDLRASNALVWLKEKLLFAGKKIKDVLFTIFGVRSSDARFDITEVVKRVEFPVNIQTITNVSASSLDKPLATLAGNGVETGFAPLVDYTAEEPGLLMVVVSVRPEASYYQGCNKFLTKGSSIYDFVIPDFANVGMQTIKNSEIYLDYNADHSTQDFAFTRRYAEFMYEPSSIKGNFRDTLLYWHSARHFSSAPSLSQEFMEVDVKRDDLNRIFAVQNSENIILECVFDMYVVRPLPKYVRYNY